MFSRDLVRMGADATIAIGPKVNDLLGGITPIVLQSSDRPKAIICTFEELEPVGLLGALMKQTIDRRSEMAVEFYILPVAYFEYMCATRDAIVFTRALETLKVADSWFDASGEGPRTRWLRAMPDPLPTNPLLENAYEGFWTAGATVSNQQKWDCDNLSRAFSGRV